MLPLASWIMQGRGHALGFVILALLSSPVLWPNGILACAAICLVWLRKGEKEGVMFSLWALIPTVMLTFFLESFIPLSLVVITSLASVVLKNTRSWSTTLLVLSILCMLAALAIETFAHDVLAVYTDAFNRFLISIKQQLATSDIENVLPDSIGTVFIAGLFGSLLIVGSFISLALARSWQAKLYNPGGFQKEIHQLRFGRIEVLIEIVFVAIFLELGAQYLTWIWLALFPMLISGIALFHAIAGIRKIAIHWYFIFYIVLMLWDPLKLFLVGVAFADSFLNFRNKLIKPTTDQDS